MGGVVRLVSPVPVEHLDDVWEGIEPIVERACTRTFGMWTPDLVYEEAKEERMLVLLPVEITDQKTVVFGAGGVTIKDHVAWGQWFAMERNSLTEERIIDWNLKFVKLLRDLKVDRFRYVGRTGWQRFLRGYNHTTLAHLNETVIGE